MDQREIRKSDEPAQAGEEGKPKLTEVACGITAIEGIPEGLRLPSRIRQLRRRGNDASWALSSPFFQQLVILLRGCTSRLSAYFAVGGINPPKLCREGKRKLTESSREFPKASARQSQECSYVS